MTASLSDLTNRIIEEHHAYARRELSRLSAPAQKVFLRHGKQHPELECIRDLMNAMAGEICTHMLKESKCFSRGIPRSF